MQLLYAKLVNSYMYANQNLHSCFAIQKKILKANPGTNDEVMRWLRMRKKHPSYYSYHCVLFLSVLLLFREVFGKTEPYKAGEDGYYRCKSPVRIYQATRNQQSEIS